MLTLWLWACFSQSEVTPPPAAKVGHFGTFEDLLLGAVAGEVEVVRREARDLVAEAETMESEGATALGGAAGFLQVAEEPAALVQGVIALARACGACHEGVAPPPEPSHDHRVAAELAAWSLVWGQPLRGDPPRVLERPFAEGPEAVLRSCAECHPKGHGLARPGQQQGRPGRR